MPQDFFITTADGWQLGASLFEAPGRARGVIVINSAMAVPRNLYAEFAQWWSERGFHVVTWTYRGMGDSGRAADCDASLADWGERDLDAVLAWCEGEYPDLPRVIAAHSVGGQVLGLASRAAGADAIIPIASQSGYWRHYVGMMRPQVLFLWYLAIPVLSRLFGYFPSGTLGIFPENIPAHVAREWARWARDPEYLMGSRGPESSRNYSRITAPVLGVWIADDDMATHSAHQQMLSWYENAPVDRLELHPEKEGLERIGHFGFFRADRSAETLWPQLHDWLASKLENN
ncbi:MAG: alpha/beta fold hydrolase [Gammaproteobacteria bacterium]|nr:alpha/beta fold hydrolase [Gammaproteobacteria bacterium]